MERNGWLYWPRKWWKRIKCGAVYGHDYRQITPEVHGKIGCECKRCGKFRIF